MNKLKLIVVGVVATLALAFATVPVAHADYNLDKGISDSRVTGLPRRSMIHSSWSRVSSTVFSTSSVSCQ